MKRTEDEVFADKLDCDLFHLINKVDQRKAKWWREVSRLLRAVRPPVRARMNKADRDSTV